MRDDGWLLKALNSNPSVSLDKLLKQTTTSLAPMVFEPSDAVYFEIPNEAIKITTSNFGYGENPVTPLPYKLKINLGGTILLKAYMYYTVPESASGGGYPSLQIYVNGICARELYASEGSKYYLEEGTVSVNKGDVITLALDGGIQRLNGGGVWRSNTLYLQENSIKLYAQVKDQRYTDGIEVSDQ